MSGEWVVIPILIGVTAVIVAVGYFFVDRSQCACCCVKFKKGIDKYYLPFILRPFCRKCATEINKGIRR